MKQTKAKTKTQTTSSSAPDRTQFTDVLKCSLDINGKAAIIGDVHIGVKSDSSDFHDAHWQVFDWIDTELSQRGVSDVIFLGDLFHNRNEINVKTLTVAHNLISIFSESYRTFLVIGNHDSYYKNTTEISSLNIFDLLKNVKVIHNLTEISLNGEPALLVPWIIRPEEFVSVMKAEGKKYKYIFGHFEFKGGQLTQSHTNISHGFDTSSVTQFLTDDGKIYSGHYHLKRHLGKRVYYVGSVMELTWADSAEEKAIHIIDKDHNVEMVVNDTTPKFIKVNLSEINKTKHNIKDNYVKLFIDMNINEMMIKRMVDVLDMKGPKSVNVIDLTMGNIDIGEVDLEKIKDPAILIKEYMTALKVEKDIDKDLLLRKIEEVYREAITR